MTKTQLAAQMEQMRQRISELETSEARLSQAMQKLREDKRYFESLLFNMHEDIMVIDQDYRIAHVNKAFLATTGRKREEIVGRHCYEVSHGYHQPCEKRGEECMLHKVFETGKAASCRHQHTRADGSKVWVDLLLSPSRDEKGNVVHVIETVRDVTDFVNAEKALRRSQRLASIGRLAAEIAHEINNPLTSVLTFCKLATAILQQEPFPVHRLAELLDYISYLHSEAERCADISRKLLDFSRPSEVGVKENDVRDILEKTLDILRHRAELQEIKINTAYATEVPPLSCNFKRLQQAFINIFWNAIEAMPDGGQLTVSSSFDRKQDMVEVQISDTGLGIPEEDVERIFEPFFTTKAEGKGLGLGLSVAYGIIRQHQGEINVNTEVGEGTRFIVQLPAGLCARPSR